MSTFTLLKDFTNGQGVGFASYFTYAQDHDSNYTLIESKTRQLENQLSALQGPLATLARDYVVADDPTGPVIALEGLIGANSYDPTFITGNTQIQIGVGKILLSAGVVENGAPVVLTGSGSAGTRWINVDVNGVPNLATAAAQAALDLATVNWNGSSFDVATLTLLAEIFADGDEWTRFRRRPEIGSAANPTLVQRDGLASTFPFPFIAERVRQVEDLLGGRTVSSDPVADALGPAALIRGTAALPGIILSSGGASPTIEQTTGLFRQAANAIGVAIVGAELLRFAGPDLLMTGGRIREARKVVTYNATNTDVDLAGGNLFDLTFGSGNIANLNLLSEAEGQTAFLIIRQDGVGSRTVTTWDSAIKWSGGGTPPTLSTGANAVDLVRFVVNAAGEVLADFVADYQ